MRRRRQRKAEATEVDGTEQMTKSQSPSRHAPLELNLIHLNYASCSSAAHSPYIPSSIMIQLRSLCHNRRIEHAQPNIMRIWPLEVCRAAPFQTMSNIESEPSCPETQAEPNGFKRPPFISTLMLLGHYLRTFWSPLVHEVTPSVSRSRTSWAHKVLGRR